MKIQLRQICLVAAKLAPVIDDLTDILGINPCHIDPGVGQWGLENTLLPIGRNFLEVVAPVTDGTAAGRYLDRRGGDGGYMVITQGENRETYDTVRLRAPELGVRVAFERSRDTSGLCQLHPRDMIACFYEIEWNEANDFNGLWHPAGHSWEDKVRQDVTVDLLGVEIQGDDPEALGDHWAKVIGTPVTGKGDVRTIALNNAVLRFVESTDGRGPGLGGLVIAVANRAHILARARVRGCYVNDDRVDICGTRFYLTDAD